MKSANYHTVPVAREFSVVLGKAKFSLQGLQKCSPTLFLVQLFMFYVCLYIMYYYIKFRYLICMKLF